MSPLPPAGRLRPSLAGVVAPVALVSLLVLCQAWYSILALDHVLYEELAESVRNPFWIAHHLVYDGVSSNVGWYALLAAGYSAFGFSFTLAKAVRVGLHVLSLGCAGHLLVRYVGVRRAIVPLAVIGLSPALLAFNSLSTTYGIDLQWVPILFWLLLHTADRRAWVRVVTHATTGFSVILACLMWPVCVFYLPLWVLVYAGRRAGVRGVGRHVEVAVMLVGGMLPLVGILAWLHNAATWVHDPVTGSGAFRGGGTGLVGSPSILLSNAGRIGWDVGVSGSSYYFWVPRPDLSGVLGWIAAATVVAMIPAMCRTDRRSRILVVSSLAVAACAALVSSVTAGPPGLRRATVCVAVFYGLYAAAWRLALNGWGAQPRAWLPRVQVGALSLLLLHHALAVVPNGRSVHMGPPGEIGAWFEAGTRPAAALDRWVAAVEAGRALDCRLVHLSPSSCRYAEVYAAVAGERWWSRHQADTDILAYDPDNGRYVSLSPQGWPFGSRR